VTAYPGRGLHGEVVSALGLRIVRGDYAPGSTIEVESLESELGVSKTVIREALRVLGAKGLVDSRPKRGTFVRDRDVWNLLDTDVMLWRREADVTNDTLLTDRSELRNLVEPACARLASLRRTDEDLAKLDAALARMVEASEDADKAVAADLDFHLLMLHASHNELMIRMDVVIIHALGARDRLVHRPGLAWRDSVPDHVVVLEAVRRGDADAAAEAMTTLLHNSSEDHARAS
jgi:GntR family galactonate operon transcriptional repressor